MQLVQAQHENMVLSPVEIISLEEAGIPGGAFAMRELDREHLESLDLSDNRKWPNILVTLSSRGYVLIDGYHRWEVAKRHDWELKATCKAFSNEQDIIEAAFRANLKHGLKANAQTKGDYAYWLHLTYPQLEQTEIASRVGITQGAVSKAIARREAAAKQAEEDYSEHDESERIKKDCKKFARSAIRFIKEFGSLDDEELSRAILSSVRGEDKVHLERVGRLLRQGPRSQFIKH
jgi:hypothetical protein